MSKSLALAKTSGVKIVLKAHNSRRRWSIFSNARFSAANDLHAAVPAAGFVVGFGVVTVLSATRVMAMNEFGSKAGPNILLFTPTAARA